MSNYQHKKGTINDNAIEALLHDPLFRQRIERKKKGGGAIIAKPNAAKTTVRRPVVSKLLLLFYHWPSATEWDYSLLLLCCLSRSRISVSSSSSFVGTGAALGSSAFL